MKPGGGIAITAPNGLALFLKRSPDSRRPGEWNFPGGHVEEGEDLEQAARRETHEETGYRDTKPMREVARTPIDDEGEEGVGLEDYVTFQTKVDEPFTPKLDQESSAYAWAPIDQPPEPLHPGVRDAIKQISKDQAEQPTISKRTADYLYPAPDPDRRRCGICSMYRGDDVAEGRCTLVLGGIDPYGDCKHFDPMVKHAEDRVIAFDRSLENVGGESGAPAQYRRTGLAFDYASARTYDADNRLHVNPTNISKANICPYRGEEIPGAEELGLDPHKVYQLLRDPDELARAAPTFNRLPLLSEHVPVTSEDHHPELVIGSTGSDSEFSPPYLRNSLVVWAKQAIDEIEREEKKELSCAYRYRADMTPGVFKGTNYDGVMRDIVGNHVALVKEGRAGNDVVVGDSKENTMTQIKPTTVKLTRKGTLAFGMLTAYLQPRMAADAKLELAPLLTTIRRKTFAQDKAALFSKIQEHIKGKLAKDASVDGLASILDMIEAHEPESQDAGQEGASHTSSSEATPQRQVDALPDFLKGKMSDDDYSHAMDLLQGMMPGRDQRMEELSTSGPGKDNNETQPGGPGTAKVGGADEDDEEDKKEKAVDRKAMDAAIKSAVKEAREKAIKDQRRIREAETFVRPWVGETNLAFDSADDVYKAALTALNVSVDGVHPSAYKTILEQVPQPGKQPRERTNLAQDAANGQSFFKMFPEAERIGQL